MSRELWYACVLEVVRDRLDMLQSVSIDLGLDLLCVCPSAVAGGLRDGPVPRGVP